MLGMIEIPFFDARGSSMDFRVPFYKLNPDIMTMSRTVRMFLKKDKLKF